jgi:hypothetical protein
MHEPPLAIRGSGLEDVCTEWRDVLLADEERFRLERRDQDEESEVKCLAGPKVE